jgi:WD40 repeat protein
MLPFANQVQPIRLWLISLALPGAIAGLLALQASNSASAISERPELILQAGHSYKADAMAFSPDGRHIATGGADTAIKIWDSATGRVLRTLGGHAGGVKAVAFSPDGQRLASGGNDGRIKLWELATGNEVDVLTGQANALAFSRDGRWLALGGADFKVRLWNLATRESQQFDGHYRLVLALAFSPDGNYLASGGADSTINLWDLTKKGSKKKDEKQIEPIPLAGHTGWVRSLAFSPDGKTLVSCGSDKTVRLWKIPKGKLDRTIRRQSAPLLTAAFIAGGAEAIVCGEDRTIERFDVATGALLQTIPGRASADANLNKYETAVFSADGRWLAANAGGRTSELRQVAPNGEARVLESRVNGVKAVAFSQDGRWLATGNQDATMTLWDTVAGRAIAKLGGGAGSVEALAFSRDGQWLAWGSRGGAIAIWDLGAACELRKWEAHADGVASLVFTPDGKWLISGSADSTIKVWETKTWNEAARLTGHKQGVTALSVSADGQRLISAGVDQTVRLWDLGARQLTRTLTGHRGIVYGVASSADGKWIASASEDRSVRLWKGTSGEHIRTLTGHSGAVYSVALSPDGKQVAAGSASSEIRVWETDSGNLRFNLPGHAGGVNGLCFSERWLVSGGEDGGARVWQADTGDSAATLVSFRAGSQRESSDWLVVTPDGLFDGSPAAWGQILWHFARDPYNPSPVEIFFDEFFYPDLLSDVLSGKRPRADKDIALRDRRQPRLKLATADGAQAGSVATRNLKVKLEVAEHSPGSGARDVRLFRNGLLVKVWRGDALKAGGGTATLEYSVPLVAGENRLTAYAFNRDNVKSADETLTIIGSKSLARSGTLYILAVGINQYSNRDFNLRFAVADAELFSDELKRRQERIGRFARIEIVRLLDRLATRANLLAALKRLAGGSSTPLPADAPADLERLKPAQPEDAVIIYFAGHGTAQKPRFYLIPHDLGYQGKRDEMDEDGWRQALASSISDLELEQHLEGVDAGHLLLVIDACKSGQALEAEEKRRGPMNSKGLAQLAYEKGMNILTAAQSYQDALEDSKLGHGYLTYALVVDGIQRMTADARPKDGEVWLREWLDFATEQAPRLQEAKQKEKREIRRLQEAKQKEGRDLALEMILDVQRPKVFYRREVEAQPLVIAKP